MKYNKSEIMKAAWSLFRMSKRWVNSLSFSECLRRAWSEAKEAAKDLEAIQHEICKVIDNARIYMRRSVIAEAGRMGWVLTGNTYAARKSIKRMGFRFDGEARNWYTQDADTAIAFANA